ncbi:MAG: hypothetical protein WD448_00765, partial [Woeseia sp.]
MITESFPLHLDWAGWVSLPPALLFFAAAILLGLMRGDSFHRLRQIVLLATPVIGAMNLLTLDTGSSFVWNVLQFELVQLRVDRLSMLFGLLFHLGALLGFIYALR